MSVPARVSFVTLAVRDFARMATFYRQFGRHESKDSNEDFVAFQTGGAILGLFPAKYYASLGDAPAAGSFKGFELAMNLNDAAQVDQRVHGAEVIRGPPVAGTAEGPVHRWPCVLVPRPRGQRVGGHLEERDLVRRPRRLIFP